MRDRTVLYKGFSKNAACRCRQVCMYPRGMCVNFVPVTAAAELMDMFGLDAGGADGLAGDVWPGGFAPFIRLAPGTTDPQQSICVREDGIFRFVPDFVSKMGWARTTQNVRSETVDVKSTYIDAWWAALRCIIPAQALYEMDYETGNAVRWRIQRADGEPMGIAGVYRAYRHPDGREVFAMGMLTCNADTHPFMKQLHAPGDEKRMVVILEPEQFEDWLKCPVTQAKSKYCVMWLGEFLGEPAMLPKRAKKEQPLKKPTAKKTSPTPDIFADDVVSQTAPSVLKRTKPAIKKTPPQEPTQGMTGDLFGNG